MSELYISYLELYKQSPSFARKKLVEAYLKLRNISEVARIFRTTRKVEKRDGSRKICSNVSCIHSG